MSIHPDRLVAMFNSAAVNQFFPGITLHFEGMESKVSIKSGPAWQHAGEQIHGALYMRLLDDAAYFAAALREKQRFVVTASLDVRFLRPVGGGLLVATGRLLRYEDRKLMAESVLHDESGKLIARATGVFVPSRQYLQDVAAYTKP